MDWSIVSSILVASVGLWGAFWAVSRERAPMRELERITIILKDTPDDAPKRAYLEGVRDHLSMRINHRYRAPRKATELFSVFYGLFAGTAFLVFYVLVRVTTSIEVTPASTWVTLGAVTAWFLAAGFFAIKRMVARYRWLKVVEASEDTHTTDRSSF